MDLRSATEEDLQRLERALRAALAKAGWTPPRGRPLDLLNLACGRCDEARVLAEVFGGRAPQRAPAASGPDGTQLVGIDIRRREIGEAGERWAPGRGAGPARSFEFLHGDATELDRHRALADAFDVVFFRHQNYWHGAPVWEKIFDQALAKTAPGGLVALTSYFDREHAQALAAIKALGGEVVVDQKNPGSRELATAGKSVDRHLAIVRPPR